MSVHVTSQLYLVLCTICNEWSSMVLFIPTIIPRYFPLDEFLDILSFYYAETETQKKKKTHTQTQRHTTAHRPQQGQVTHRHNIYYLTSIIICMCSTQTQHTSQQSTQRESDNVVMEKYGTGELKSEPTSPRPAQNVKLIRREE